MFLSKLTLNTRDKKVLRDLTRPYDMHRTLMNTYARARVANRCDLLFRAESSRDGVSFVLVQTREDPGPWAGLPLGYLLRPAESKPLSLPFMAGQQLRFRIRANPTKRVAAKNQRLGAVMAGKRVGLTTEAEQMDWLIRRGEMAGFKIPGEWLDGSHPNTGERVKHPNFRVDVVSEGRTPNGKPGFAGEFLAVRFDGLLVVTDPEKLKMAVASGVGSGKAFGFGLLSLARAE